MSDLSILPNELIRKSLIETVERELKLKKFSIKLDLASISGESNFMGFVYRVFCNEEQESSTLTTLILKVAPQCSARRTGFSTRNSFLREIHMYTAILPAFRQFEQSTGERDGFTEYPKCYRTVDVDVSECVLLEDLSARGFMTVDRHTETITANHVNLVLRAFGKFHAISFALKDQQPERFKELTENLFEFIICPNEPAFQTYYSAIPDIMLSVLTNEKDAYLREKVKKLFENSFSEVAATCIDLTATKGVSVVTHGDVWHNNLMFTYDDNSKPTQIQFIDWQISRHSSPIVDVVHFLFFCTTMELRQTHYEEFLNTYYDSLSTHIRKLGSDPEKLFPLTTMQEHLHKFGKFALILAAIVFPLFMKDSGEKTDLDKLANEFMETKEINIQMEASTYKNYSKRMRELVVDMVRLGYI